ncbi:MAG: 50S ribosomal protein L15e [Candidatus Altiarchaeota archaeon]
MGYLKYVKEAHKSLRAKIKKKENKELKELISERKIAWRRGPTIVRLEHPTRIDRARGFGYKAKQGLVVARIRVRRGGMRKSRPSRGRKPKRMGVNKITPNKSIQRMAEERVNKRFPNLEVLGSYWVFADGQFIWHEVVLADPSHPAIKTDRDIGWIASGSHRKRSLRGLTPAGTKGRGQRKRGKGAEKVRPSLRAKGRRAK